ncbi:MAG: diguanylate cyclase [Ectothiorhodospiraceae bacterium]|nr:diguanylate cyclase [Ectothiorhodospiraceae bacterium]
MADTPEDDRFQTQLELLRERYRERLGREIADLASLAGQLMESRDKRTAEARLASLRLGLHRMVGTAGTFGYPALSDQARLLEQQLDQTISDARPPHQALDNDFPDRVLLLANHLARTVSGSIVTEARAGAARERAPATAHILVAEAEAAAGRELQGALDQFGYRTSLAGDAADLRQLLDRTSPDVLVINAEFEDQGEPATRFLKQWQRSGPMVPPTIFIGSHDSFDTRHAVARAGGEGYYLKPVDAAKLADRVESLLDASSAEPYRVLIVDDDQELGEHYRLTLQAAGMTATLVTRPRGLLEAVHGSRPELVLMDMHMPEFFGVDLARMIRMQDEWAGLPIVFLSAETDIDEQINALGQGGDDFITKPIADRHLVAAVLARCRRARKLSELIARDSLTGLLTHARIKEALAVEFQRAQRTGRPATVAMLDIDRFKRINDSYGHAVGDRVIKALANLLRHRLRRTDVLGRYGGEEFVAVLPDCDVDKAEEIFDDVRRRLQALPFTGTTEDFSVTLSAGLASLLDYGLADDALQAADEALYTAKAGGRNRIHLARPLNA